MGQHVERQPRRVDTLGRATSDTDDPATPRPAAGGGRSSQTSRPRHLARAVVVAAAVGVATALAWGTGARAAPCRAEYWVSPDGSDSAPGDRAHPFRTLATARDAVRADGRRGQCEIVVNIRGEHRLEAPLVLEAQDSGAPGHDVVYRAAPGERAVLSGAVRVEGWTLHDPGLGIWRAYTGPRQTRQLYVNGVRVIRARTAPYPAEFTRTATGYRFVGAGATPGAWTNPSAVEAVTVTQWKMMSCPVESIAGPDIAMADPCWSNANVFQAPPGQEPLWNFQLLSRFENAYEFMDEPGEWYLDAAAGWLYYIPRPGEDLATAVVELPVLETLIDGRGQLGRPVSHLRFERLTFAHATWLGPSGPNGYVADQSGFHLVGRHHRANIIGHDRHVVRTPGNVRFRYAHHVSFVGNSFVRLGGVALDFDTGGQRNNIAENEFMDIGSAAIQLGGVAEDDHHPAHPAQVTRDNRIVNNLIQRTGRDYADAAGIYVGFTARTLVAHNEIYDVPWSGIAIGWGWGLLDQGSFPGLPNARRGEWGLFDTPSTASGNRILHNRIHGFLNELWDGGAIYTQGRQGSSFDDGELIAWNVASGKRPSAGGNTFYTDGGSRYVTLFQNVSFDNPEGVTDFGPCGVPSALPLCWLVIPYGTDMGGCVPYGDLRFLFNYWQGSVFFDVCPYKDHPVNLELIGNQIISSDGAGAPDWILRSAGRQKIR
jgi:hypothetical protein